MIPDRRDYSMVRLEYYDGKRWVKVGTLWCAERAAWLSLRGNDLNHRTINTDDGSVLTDKSKPTGVSDA